MPRSFFNAAWPLLGTVLILSGCGLEPTPLKPNMAGTTYASFAISAPTPVRSQAEIARDIATTQAAVGSGVVKGPSKAISADPVETVDPEAVAEAPVAVEEPVGGEAPTAEETPAPEAAAPASSEPAVSASCLPGYRADGSACIFIPR